MLFLNLLIEWNMLMLNMQMLQIVANGLEDIKEEVVFVGGAVAQLYATNPAASDIRSTTDIDFVVEISTKSEYDKLEQRLRKKGFINDSSFGAPICRMIFKGIKVDVMPTDSKILGFTNRWYYAGIENKIIRTLDDGTEIFVFTHAYYIASKLEAMLNRGPKDLRLSHDFEDIIYVLDNEPAIIELISAENINIKEYLREQFSNILNGIIFLEAVESVLPYGSGVERTKLMIKKIKQITQIL